MLLDASHSQLVLVDYQAQLMPAIFEADAGGAERGAPGQDGAACSRCRSGAPSTTLEARREPCPSIRALYQRDPARRCTSAPSRKASANGCACRPRPRQGNARSLPKHLQKPQPAAEERNTIVIAGCEAHVCLLQTALDLLEDEFEVWVVTDACSSRTERNRDAAFDRLAGAGAELVTTEMVGFEWLRTAEHPAFPELLTIADGRVQPRRLGPERRRATPDCSGASACCKIGLHNYEFSFRRH